MHKDDAEAVENGSCEYRYGRIRTLKYRLLSSLPGKRGIHYRRKRMSRPAEVVDREFRASLEKTKGLVAIDLGANFGSITRLMSATASEVFAFEPDPYTAKRFRENTSDLANVHFVEAAAGTKDERLPLYRHVAFDEDPERFSVGSSLYSKPKLINEKNQVAEVQVIDFVDYLKQLNKDIGVLKIDIEGAELELLERLFDEPIIDRISYIFCETHELLFPEEEARFVELRKRAHSFSRPVIALDWR